MGKSRYTLRVEEEKLERWNDAVDASDSEYSSLRHLITLAVTRELSDSYILRDEIEGLDVGIDTSVEHSVEEIRTEMAELRDAVESLEATQSSDSEQLADHAKTLYSLIPILKPDNLDDWLDISIRNTPVISSEEVVQGYGRVEDIVRYMEEDEWTVRKTIAKLEQDMDDVHTGMDAEGAKRVYKLVEELPDDTNSADDGE